MPHLHLSVQAGDDLILKRMKRRHDRADVLAVARRARSLRPDVALGADLIAGFPTESEEAFQRTLDLVDEAGLTHLHVFPYSAREETPAARMPPVPGDQIKDRAARLRAKGLAVSRDFLGAQVGTVAEVLMERGGIGHTAHYAPLRPDRPVAVGAVFRARVTAVAGDQLLGEVE